MGIPPGDKKTLSTTQSRLSDLRLFDLSFYPTCRVGTINFANSACSGMNCTPPPRTSYSLRTQMRQLQTYYCSGAAKKVKDAQKQTPIGDFLKNNRSFTHLHYVKFYFCL